MYPCNQCSIWKEKKLPFKQATYAFQFPIDHRQSSYLQQNMHILKNFPWGHLEPAFICFQWLLLYWLPHSALGRTQCTSVWSSELSPRESNKVLHICASKLVVLCVAPATRAEIGGDHGSSCSACSAYYHTSEIQSTVWKKQMVMVVSFSYYLKGDCW